MYKAIKENLKRIRNEKGLSQVDLANLLNMDRTTYSKLESGDTGISLHHIKNISDVLNTPLTSLITDETYFLIDKQVEVMLDSTEYYLSKYMIKTIPYSELTEAHKEFLKKKGFETKESYYTPEGGRLYKFGSRDLFKFMIEECSMGFAFEMKLNLRQYWRDKWEEYLSKTNEFEIDDREYFDVVLIDLKMSDRKPDEVWSVQIAVRDFPSGSSWAEGLNYIIKKYGAISGEILAWTDGGYDPVSEIIS